MKIIQKTFDEWPGETYSASPHSSSIKIEYFLVISPHFKFPLLSLGNSSSVYSCYYCSSNARQGSECRPSKKLAMNGL